MKKVILTISYIIAAIAVIGCAKTETIGPNDAYQRYLEAWMHVNYPDATPSGLGIYIIEDQQGSGVKVGEEGYILLDYKVTDLEGNISSYTDALTAQQLGKYNQTTYYGPKFLTTTKTTLPAGLRSAVVGQQVGTSRKVIIPSWLMSYKSYDTEEDKTRRQHPAKERIKPRKAFKINSLGVGHSVYSGGNARHCSYTDRFRSVR